MRAKFLARLFTPLLTRSAAVPRGRSRLGVALSLALSLALGASSSAFAGENQDKFSLSADVLLEGVALSAGSYHVEWTGEGEGLEVQIRKGREVLVTAQATRRELALEASADSASIDPVTNGTPVLVGMKFGGRNFEIRFATASAQRKVPAEQTPVRRADRSR